MINLRRAGEKSLQERPISDLYDPNLNAHYRSFRFSSNNACDMAYNIYKECIKKCEYIYKIRVSIYFITYCIAFVIAIILSLL